MSTLVSFLRQLLHEGTIVFRALPAPSADEHLALEELRQAHAVQVLDVAGPSLDFHPGTALVAAEVVRQACWFLVHRDEPAAEVERRLTLPPPVTPAEHLSGDLMLRFLPQLHRRARALAPNDMLTTRLTLLLRQWPLSGVLADVPEGPLMPPEFGGHAGLQLLYAERLALSGRPAWVPEGRARQYVELVLKERSQEHSPLGRLVVTKGEQGA